MCIEIGFVKGCTCFCTDSNPCSVGFECDEGLCVLSSGDCSCIV